jgi:UDP-N-acetylmuramoylalanine--D-glutamate ligase
VNYKNKKIVIFGLGNYKKGSGISTALFFARRGAKLIITDLKKEKDLTEPLKRLKKYKNIEYVLGRHRKNDFKNADFIFKNPGVPKHSPYLKTKIPIINDWSVFFEEYPRNLVIGITGTKGKSTTAALIHHVLKTAKKDAVLCGNIGQSPLAVLNKIKKGTVIVAELSSWLLADLKTSPQIAIITNLMPDHLDKYKNLKEYYKDKKIIFKFQKPEDYLIKNKQGTDAAIEVAKILKIPQTTINKAVKTFKGVSGRLEFIKEKRGVKYYNDTCATTPEATIFALQQLKKHKGKIVLIAGGVNKKLNYSKLRREIPKYTKKLILLKGDAFPEANIKTMREAAKKAQEYAEKGDIILLSPGASSFNLFKNEFDKGEQFVKAVKKL